MVINIFYYSLLLLGFTIILQPKMHAEWDLTELKALELVDCSREEILDKADYKDLKTRVLKELKNSWCSQEKASLIMDLIILDRPQICVEIGVFNGATFLPIAAALKYMNAGLAYAIDPWSSSAAVRNMDNNDPNKQWWAGLDLNSVYSSFLTLIKAWNLNAHSHVLRLTSDAAAEFIEQIDFLHMDGDYSECGSISDVALYLPKLKTRGYILFSNLFLTVNDIQPKMKAFTRLLDSCEIVCEVDHNNTVLLRKIK